MTRTVNIVKTMYGESTCITFYLVVKQHTESLMLVH